MYKVRVEPIGLEFEIDQDTSLKQALMANGQHIHSTCGGHAACGECVIKILEGSNHLNAPSFEELSLLGNVFHITKERLSCQTFIHGDVTIDITEQLEEKAPIARSKQTSTPRLRKKEDVGQMYEERQKKREEKQAKKETQVKPWEVEKDPSREKSLGGNRRPKAFKYDSDKEE